MPIYQEAIRRQTSEDTPRQTMGWPGQAAEPKRANGKQQEPVCVIPAITKNQSHKDTVRYPRVVMHMYTIVQIPRRIANSPRRQITRTQDLHRQREERRNHITQKRINNGKPRNDCNIRKTKKHILSRRGCGKLLAYRRPSHGHRPPPYGRNRPVQATDQKTT